MLLITQMCTLLLKMLVGTTLLDIIHMYMYLYYTCTCRCNYIITIYLLIQRYGVCIYYTYKVQDTQLETFYPHSQGSYGQGFSYMVYVSSGTHFLVSGFKEDTIPLVHLQYTSHEPEVYLYIPLLFRGTPYSGAYFIFHIVLTSRYFITYIELDQVGDIGKPKIEGITSPLDLSQFLKLT